MPENLELLVVIPDPGLSKSLGLGDLAVYRAHSSAVDFFDLRQVHISLRSDRGVIEAVPAQNQPQEVYAQGRKILLAQPSDQGKLSYAYQPDVPPASKLVFG